ncbi:MAG TPA: hypothetical protein VF411_10625 [Bacteroidia bacterium]
MITISVNAQNAKNLYYIIKKKDIDNGKLKIIYRDEKDSIRPIQMCDSKLKAEGLNIENGVPVFHFEKIPTSKYDTVVSCISNNTPLGHFEIDVKKRKIGDPTKVVKIPFRAVNWDASLTLYKIRFAQNGKPVFAESDPAALLVSVIYGYTFGYAKINYESITRYYMTIGPSLGLTSANLNSGTVTNPSLLLKDQSNVAFSYGISAMLGRNNFGFSFSFGFDMSIGKNSNLWIYQNKPWFGVGVSSNLGRF